VQVGGDRHLHRLLRQPEDGGEGVKLKKKRVSSSAGGGGVSTENGWR
jgi:hypothetical protein